MSRTGVSGTRNPRVQVLSRFEGGKENMVVFNAWYKAVDI